MPSSSAARITSMPLGTLISKPSMATVTLFCGGAFPAASLVDRVTTPPPGRAGRTRGPTEQGRGGGIEWAATPLLVGGVLVPEELNGRDDRAHRTVAERAEGATQDVVTHVQELVQVFLCPLAPLQPGKHPNHPVGSFAARRAFTA